MSSRIVYVIPILALLIGVGMYQLMNKHEHVDAYTLSGEQLIWADMKEDWIVINFFAQWCAPCLREIPELNAFNHSLPSNTRMFMVSFDGMSDEDLIVLSKEHQIHVPLIVNNGALSFPFDFPSALPATFILSREGKTVKSIYGEVTQEALNAYIKELNLQAL